MNTLYKNTALMKSFLICVIVEKILRAEAEGGWPGGGVRAGQPVLQQQDRLPQDTRPAKHTQPKH